MSHITKGTVKVLDLDALGTAAGRLGFDLVRGVERFNWYGRFLGDSPGIRGMSPEQYGKCEHVLRRQGAAQGDYEIGVARAQDGAGYELHYDTWGSGQKLVAQAGQGLGKLTVEYGVEAASREFDGTLAREGWEMERESLPNGRARLVMVRR